MRKLALIIAALSLVGCNSLPPHNAGHAQARVWNRDKVVDPEAAKVQMVVAMQAKQARCKSEVEPRPGRDGTSPRDWKCKGPKQS